MNNSSMNFDLWAITCNTVAGGCPPKIDRYTALLRVSVILSTRLGKNHAQKPEQLSLSGSFDVARVVLRILEEKALSSEYRYARSYC